MRNLKMLKGGKTIQYAGTILLILGIILPMVGIVVPSVATIIKGAVIIADETAPDILTSTVGGTIDTPTPLRMNSTIDIILEIDDGTEGSGIRNVICNITSVSGDEYSESFNLEYIMTSGASLENWGKTWNIPTLDESTKIKLEYTATDLTGHFIIGSSYGMIIEKSVPRGYFTIDGKEILTDNVATGKTIVFKFIATFGGSGITSVEIEWDNETIPRLKLVEKITDNQWEITHTSTYGTHTALGTVYIDNDEYKFLDVEVLVIGANQSGDGQSYWDIFWEYLKDWDPRSAQRNPSDIIKIPSLLELINILTMLGGAMIIGRR